MGRCGFESRGAAPWTGFSPRGGPRAWASRGSAEINDSKHSFVPDAATPARSCLASRYALARDYHDLPRASASRRLRALVFSSTSQELSTNREGRGMVS